MVGTFSRYHIISTIEPSTPEQRGRPAGTGRGSFCYSPCRTRLLALLLMTPTLYHLPASPRAVAVAAIVRSRPSTLPSHSPQESNEKQPVLRTVCSIIAVGHDCYQVRASLQCPEHFRHRQGSKQPNRVRVSFPLVAHVYTTAHACYIQRKHKLQQRVPH